MHTTTTTEDDMNNLILDVPAIRADVDPRKLCMALIWLKGSTSVAEHTRIRESIMSRPGVVSIEPSARSSSLFIVRFDRNSTCASGIVGWLRKSGLPAVLVGC
jgi:hypothetical protein